MKKIIAALLAVLCLAGCAAEEQTPVVPEEPEIVEKQVVEEVSEEKKPQEVPMTQEETAETGEPKEPAATVEYTVQNVEGLIEDTVGYVLAYPVVNGIEAAETVNQFYTDLTAYLEDFTEETIYEAAQKNHVTANVYGEVETLELVGEEVKVVYTYRVEYSDKTTDENSRTDYFHIQTGENRAE